MKNELYKELENLKQDRIRYQLELNNEKRRIAHQLQNEMGKDIDDVLSGKVKVELTFKEKIKYKIRNFLDFVFNLF